MKHFLKLEEQIKLLSSVRLSDSFSSQVNMDSEEFGESTSTPPVTEQAEG